MTTLWVLQHNPSETLGIIAQALEDRGISPQYIRTFKGDPIPREMGDAGGLIVMGGPMGVYEYPRYPFLRDEMRLIEMALRDGKPVLGVCLGSQLLAAALGAPVTKGPKKEIGWYPIGLAESAQSDPLWKGMRSPFTAFHWHGDIFELPRGSVSLAFSDLTRHQAFRYGRNAYGFLFHMEVTEEIIRDMVKIFTDELDAAGIEGQTIIEKTRDHLPSLQEIGRTIFQRWAGLIEV